MRDIANRALLVLLNIMCLIPALMILALVAVAKAIQASMVFILDIFMDTLNFFANLETSLKARIYKENKSEETQRTI